jgi:hypothetical protein
LRSTTPAPSLGGAVVFELLGGAEVSTGIVSISADLWFGALAPGYRFSMHVREAQGVSDEFASIRFDQSGNIAVFDENGWVGSLIEAIETGRRLRVILE